MVFAFCKMQNVAYKKFFINGKIYIQWLQQIIIIIIYDETKLKNVVKFYVPTWSIFTVWPNHILQVHYYVSLGMINSVAMT